MLWGKETGERGSNNSFPNVNSNAIVDALNTL